MKAIESRSKIHATRNIWERTFRNGAEVVGAMGGEEVLWHQGLGIWGSFGKTGGKGGDLRDWNAFGQKPNNFRSNIIVEINTPPQGIDRSLQAVFATDNRGQTWLLHQGRMSVAGSRITEADFIAATNLQPATVSFSDGSRGEYHKVANLGMLPSVAQESIAAFVARCAHARAVKLANGAPIADLTQVKSWERGLSPEAVGMFVIAPRAAGIGRRYHAEIWQAIAGELQRRKVPHSNDRVSQYGPDLFTYGSGPKVLFEIKSKCSARDVFEGVGQLHIYDRLLGGGYRKVLVLPHGMGNLLSGTLSSLMIDTVEFHKEGRKVAFENRALSKCLK